MPVHPLTVGTPAPPFTLPNGRGGEISLSDFSGRPVILYFYPKDATPGCTKEACAFRDASKALRELEAVVLGVSRGTLKSHLRFLEKYCLEFPLLADPELKAINAYGVFREKTMYGKKVMGVERSTLLIGPDGVIRKIWRGVKVDGHDAEVLEALKGLMRQSSA